MFAQKCLKNMKAQKPGAKLEQEKKKEWILETTGYSFFKVNVYVCVEEEIV